MSPKVLLQERASFVEFSWNMDPLGGVNLRSHQNRKILQVLDFGCPEMLVHRLHHRACCAQGKIEKWTKYMRISRKDIPWPVSGCISGYGSPKSNFPTLLEVEQTCKNNTQGLRSQHSSAAALCSCFEDIGKKHPVPLLPPQQQTEHKTQDCFILNTWKFHKILWVIATQLKKAGITIQDLPLLKIWHKTKFSRHQDNNGLRVWFKQLSYASALRCFKHEQSFIYWIPTAMAKEVKPKVAHASCDVWDKPTSTQRPIFSRGGSSFEVSLAIEGYSRLILFHSALETSASRIVWSTEIGQWNGLTFKGIANHKHDVKNIKVPGPPRNGVTIWSILLYLAGQGVHWNLAPGKMLVLQLWTRKVLSNFPATAQRPWWMQICF